MKKSVIRSGVQATGDPKQKRSVGVSLHVDVRDVEEKLRARADGIRDWLSREAPECAEEQLHLDDGIERVYWHYGYLCSLNDTLRLLDRRGDLSEVFAPRAFPIRSSWPVWMEHIISRFMGMIKLAFPFKRGLS